MVFSPRLANMVRDATMGMSEKDVLSITGMSKAAYYRLKNGEVVGREKLVAFALGLKLPLKDIFEAAEMTGTISFAPIDVIQVGLEMSDLTPADRVEIMSLYRQKVERKEQHADRSSAAA